MRTCSSRSRKEVDGYWLERIRHPAFRATTDRLWMNLDYLNGAEMTAFVEKQAARYVDIAGKIRIRK